MVLWGPQCLERKRACRVHSAGMPPLQKFLRLCIELHGRRQKQAPAGMPFLQPCRHKSTAFHVAWQNCFPAPPKAAGCLPSLRPDGMPARPRHSPGAFTRFRGGGEAAEWRASSSGGDAAAVDGTVAQLGAARPGRMEQATVNLFSLAPPRLCIGKRRLPACSAPPAERGPSWGGAPAETKRPGVVRASSHVDWRTGLSILSAGLAAGARACFWLRSRRGRQAGERSLRLDASQDGQGGNAIGEKSGLAWPNL